MTPDLHLQGAGFAVVGAPRRGGSGTVWRARSDRDGEVALKVLHAPVDERRLDREIAVLRSLQGPTFARLVDEGRLPDGQRYLATEWIDGRTLQEVLLADGPLAPARAAHLLDQIASGLDHLHAGGVVHRDLTPANVMVGVDDRITLIDFGISAGGDLSTVTATGDLAGTPRYVAPEIIEGSTPDGRSDQYAAAVVAYEMVAGRWPFGDAPSAAAVLHHQIHGRPTPLSEHGIDAPAAEAAVAVALRKDPDRRFPSVSAFADAFAGRTAAPSRRGRSVLAAGLAVALLLVVGWLVVRDPAPTPAAVPAADGAVDRQAGTPATSTTVASPPTLPGDVLTVAVAPLAVATAADAVVCNLVAESDFDEGVMGDNYYSNLDGEGVVDVASGVGRNGSAALTLGGPQRYGLYGEIVAVSPGAAYRMAATVEVVGAPAQAAASVQWLDADFDLLEARAVGVDLVAAGTGRVEFRTGPAPDGAAHVVTRLYKDASSGFVVVDDLAFVEEGACDG